MAMGTRLSRILGFLRAGYPSGTPAVGYVSLLALLPRRVSDDEVTAITQKLLAPKPRSIDNADVGVQITHVTHGMPAPDDIARVQRRLTALGWTGGRHG